MNEQSLVCPVCGCTEIKLSDLIVQGRSRLLSCGECGLGFLNLDKSEVDEESFDTYWDSVNKQIYTDPGVISELSQKYSHFFSVIAADTPQKSLLDVGSGAGVVLSVAEQLDYECIGIEPSELAVELARERTNATVICGILTSETDLPKDFGVVTLWDVIEHVPDPESLVNTCADHLRDGGLIMLETPDEGAFLRRLIRLIGRLTKWTGKDIRTSIYYRAHRFYFTTDAMTRLLKRQGFENIRFFSWHTMFRKELLKRELYHGLSPIEKVYLNTIFWVITKVPALGNKMIAVAQKPKGS